MNPKEVENKIEIEYKKIEEEKHILISLAKIFNAYKENIREINVTEHSDHTLKNILLNKNKLEEHLNIIRKKPNDFPRMHFPSLIKTMESFLNHASILLKNKQMIELNDPMIDEIIKISRKEAPLKVSKLLIDRNKNKKKFSIKSNILLEEKIRMEDLLVLTAEAGLIEVVKELLVNGMDPQIVVKQAVISGHMCLLYLIMEMQPKFLLYQSKKWNLFHIAVSAGHTNIINFLLTINPVSKIINLVDEENGFTPIHYAVENSHEEIVELLIKNGADINKKNNNQQTPLQLALQLHKRYKYSEFTSKYFDIFRKLLEAGAEVDKDDENFPLMQSLLKALNARNVLLDEIDKLTISSDKKDYVDLLKQCIKHQYQKVPSEIFGEIGFNIIDPQILKIISECPLSIYASLARCHVKFNLSDKSKKTPINLAVELKLWKCVVYMLMFIKSDIELSDEDRNLLNHHHETLTRYFIAIMKELSMKDQLISLKNLFGKKEKFQKSKPDNALGCILYTSPSPLKLSLFGREKFRGEKVPHCIYVIVTTFADLIY